MKKLTIVVATAVALFSIGAMAEGSVGVVDMKTIFSTSPKVKEIKADLSKQFNPEKLKLETMGKTLQEAVATYEKNKPTMKADEITKTEASLTMQETAFRSAQTKFQQDVFNAQNKSLTTFMDDVKAAVKVVAEKDKLDLVIPSNDVLYTKGDTDITKAVMSNMK